MPGECRVQLYFSPPPTALQGQGWGHAPFKSHLTHLPTPEPAQLCTQSVPPDVSQVLQSTNNSTPALSSLRQLCTAIQESSSLPNLSFPLHLTPAPGDTETALADALITPLCKVCSRGVSDGVPG